MVIGQHGLSGLVGMLRVLMDQGHVLESVTTRHHRMEVKTALEILINMKVKTLGIVQ